MSKPFYVYMLLCSDGSFYTGHTENLERRVAEHQAGEKASYTRNHRPVELVWSQEFVTREEAKETEARVKGWNRAKKNALIAGDFDLLSRLASRGREGRALRDALLHKAPQGRGKDGNGE